MFNPFGIKSHGTIFEWRFCTLWAPAALTPATCETKDEINVQGNILSCQSCLLQLKESQYSATQPKLKLAIFLSVTAAVPTILLLACWWFFLNNSFFPHRSYFLTNTEKIVNKEWRNQERIILPTNKKKKKAFCSHYLALEYREVISSDALASSISITTHSWTIWKIIDLFCRPKTDSRPIPQGAMTEPELLSIRNQSKMEIRYCKWLSSLTVLSLCISVICSTS